MLWTLAIKNIHIAQCICSVSCVAGVNFSNYGIIIFNVAIVETSSETNLLSSIKTKIRQVCIASAIVASWSLLYARNVVFPTCPRTFVLPDASLINLIVCRCHMRLTLYLKSVVNNA